MLRRPQTIRSRYLASPLVIDTNSPQDCPSALFVRTVRPRCASRGCDTIENMPNTYSSSQRKLIVVIIVAAVVLVLALLSAFAWPGWALNKPQSQQAQEQQTSQPTEPSIEATALPSDATQLLKAMPDSVLNFARTKADASETWKASSPLEEYTLTYGTGTNGEDVTLVVAQWSDSDAATSQYKTLSKAMNGKELSSGAVKVKGEETGQYLIKSDDADDDEDDDEATAVWRNDTVVFQASGSKTCVQRFVEKFPL